MEKIKDDEFYKDELTQYLEHCNKNGYTPRFHYVKFLKSFYIKEAIEYNKIVDRVINNSFIKKAKKNG